MSRVLFENGNYVVCLTRAGFSIQSKRTGKGQLLKPTHPQFAQWVEAFDGTDSDESASLCRAFLA